MNNPCDHELVIPTVCDQTLGVICLDCQHLVAWCWAENHISEVLWNRACENALPSLWKSHCDQNRDHVCSLCGELCDEK